MKLYTTLALTLLLSGCALTPPESPLHNAPLLSQQEVQENYQVDREWWKSYGDPQLDQLVETALKENIDLQKSAITVRKALYTLHQSEQSLFPEASSTLGYSNSVELKEGDSTESWSAELSLSYELDLWQRLAATTKADLASLEGSRLDLEKARLSLINSVVDAWFQLAYIDRSLVLMQKNIDRYRKLQSIFKAQYEAGKTTSISLVQAQQSLLSAEQSRISLQNTRTTVVQTLNNLLNRAPDAAAWRPEPLSKLPAAEVNLDVPLSVLSLRPDLQAAEKRLDQAWYQLAAQRRSWYPKLTLGAGVSGSAASVGNVLDVPVGVGSVGLSLPFLQWNTLKWQDKSAEAEVESARLDFAETLTTALNEVATYWRQYDLARKTLANHEATLALNRKNSSYYQHRYNTGAGELSDWLEALNTEESTEQSVVSDRYEVLKYESLIYKAMAGRVHKKIKR